MIAVNRGYGAICFERAIRHEVHVTLRDEIATLLRDAYATAAAIITRYYASCALFDECYYR